MFVYQYVFKSFNVQLNNQLLMFLFMQGMKINSCPYRSNSITTNFLTQGPLKFCFGAFCYMSQPLSFY